MKKYIYLLAILPAALFFGLTGTCQFTGHQQEASMSASESSQVLAYGGYGEISKTTGRPRTKPVRGYYKKNGTYVKPYFRSLLV